MILEFYILLCLEEYLIINMVLV